MNTELDEDTRHGGTDLAGVTGIGLGSADVLDGSLLVGDGDLSDLTVHLEEDLTLAGVLAEGTDSKKLQDKNLTLLKLDVELLTNLRSRQEVASGKDGEITVGLVELLEVLEDLGVHGPRSDIALGDGGTELLGEVSLDLDKVNRLEEQTRSLIELASSTEGVASERLGEATEGLTHHTLEELKDGSGEVELAGASLDILNTQAVGDHELGKITNNLGGGSDLDDVAEELVGVLVGLLGLSPLRSKTQLGGLEHHVGQLTTRDLVLVDLGVGTSEMSLEGRVEETELRPVGVKGSDLLGIQTGVKIATLKRGNDGIDAGLRGHARQAVSGGIDGIGTSLGTGNHGGDTSTGRVVSVDVDGEIGVLLADGTDEEGSGVGLEDTGHILDTEDVDVKLDKLVNKVEVVLEVVLLLGV